MQRNVACLFLPNQKGENPPKKQCAGERLCHIICEHLFDHSRLT